MPSNIEMQLKVCSYVKNWFLPSAGQKNLLMKISNITVLIFSALVKK